MAYFSFAHFWLLSKFDSIAMQLKFYLLGMLTDPDNLSGELFLFFQQNPRWPTSHMLLSRQTYFIFLKKYLTLAESLNRFTD